jgi:hypothetical protein
MNRVSLRVSTRVDYSVDRKSPGRMCHSGRVKKKDPCPEEEHGGLLPSRTIKRRLRREEGEPLGSK